MEILLVAVKQTEIYQLLRIFQNCDIEVKLIDVAAFAVGNFVEFSSPGFKETCFGFLDVGTENTTLGILSRGKPVFIREISFGGADVFKLLNRKLGADATVDSPEYRAVLEQGLETLLSEIKLSMAYYSNHVAGAQPVQTMLVMGGGSRFIPELGMLEQGIKAPVSRPSVFSHIGIHSKLDESLVKKNEDLLPVAVGLCLRP
jgi:type IV pilus assembly protein PilM